MPNSSYSPEAEKEIELALTGLYAALGIRRPDDLFGSVCIEVRYQNGKPVGQVDVQIRYVMKRGESADGESSRRRDAGSGTSARRRTANDGG